MALAETLRACCNLGADLDTALTAAEKATQPDAETDAAWRRLMAQAKPKPEAA